jgi:pimeloyl-ACP methyl ester carboxylesterase
MFKPAMLAVLACATMTQSLSAQPKPFEGKRSRWSECDRYDFQCDGRPAIVVAPKEPAPGRPWLWRGEFFGAFPTVDQALLAKGWHVAYIDTHDMFGSPAAMKSWEAFYAQLTEQHGLSKRPVLLGMSRGGLYVYSWAALHPDRVGLIYGDAPVCDIRSWPAGKLSAKASERDWKLFLKAFDFKDEAEALKYKGSPIDVLGPIAKAKVPIIHVCGDADEAVPIGENTLVLKERYEKLGGTIEVITKKGVGHHPHSLADPTPIVEFILKNRLED